MRRPRGRRSSCDVKAWTCSRGNTNHPDSREFFDIPTFVCPCGCREKYEGDFRFSLSEILVNGHSLVGKPLDQGCADLCVPFSFAKQMEIAKRVKAVLKNMPPTDSLVMNPLHLNKSFHDILGENPDIGPTAVIIMAQILKTKGICNKDETTLYKASDISTIHRTDTVGIVRALADGCPLNAGFCEGRRLRTSRYCRPYKPPSIAKVWEKVQMSRRRSFIPGHAVVLVGARRKRGKLDYYYMNSWKHFCVRRDNRGRRIRTHHGIGKVVSTRLMRNVIRISCFKEEATDRSFVIEQLPLNFETSRNFDLLLN